MAKRQHVIELNGKKYDVTTGSIVAEASKVSVSAVASGPRHLDGFTRRKTSPAALAPATKVHQKTEKSKTLMRTTVKKPVTHKIHAKVTVTSKSAPVAATTPAVLHSSIKPERMARAETIAKSSLISKFNVNVSKTPVTVAPVSVKPAPDEAPSIPTPTITPVAVQQQDNEFDLALKLATSHFQPKVRRVWAHERFARKLHVRPAVVTAGALGVSLFVAAGAWAYFNVPNVAMQVATSRAGVKASLPTFKPAGFDLKGPIEYKPGEVALNYQSTSDNRDFKVIQRASAWNSDSLLQNFVTAAKTPYQTMQSKGRTIYIYGSNATWVDGGVWYQVTGNSSLTSEQLLNIANGL